MTTTQPEGILSTSMRLSITYLYTIFRDGYLGLDLGSHGDLVGDLKRSAARVVEVAARHQIKIEM